jgi:adsorption protein B
MFDKIDFDAFWHALSFANEELLLFSAFWFLVGAADDLLVDLIWGFRSFYRYLAIYRIRAPFAVDDLAKPNRSGLIAIMVPAWDEHRVIGSMLARMRLAWSEGAVHHRIYVGCYPNDPATIDAVTKAARFDPAIRLIICDDAGPTTKADCLNRMWAALLADELREGDKAKAVVLHDAEDCVHPDALRIFDYLVEKAAAVQLPVLAVRTPNSRWISGHYCDEFAELHGKSMIVREAIGAGMPLAGVGCAIERSQLGRIALARNGDPFDATSLTEDYELGLGLGRLNGKVILARLLDRNGNVCATRACFPDQLDAAVRQKARWMTGIALAGWDRLGWSGGIAEFWMRLRDRKAMFAAIVLTAAYMCVAISAILLLAWASGVIALPALGTTLKYLLWANAAMLSWRLCVRAIFVSRLYGRREALLSIPRSIIANIIAIMAARRASWAYLKHLCGARLTWEKTAHSHFPVDNNNG